jgi:hypothetical protein
MKLMNMRLTKWHAVNPKLASSAAGSGRASCLRGLSNGFARLQIRNALRIRDRFSGTRRVLPPQPRGKRMNFRPPLDNLYADATP